MPDYPEIEQRWRLLVPAAAEVVTVGSGQPVIRRIRALPAGTEVVLVGGRRLRLLAAVAGLRVRAEYVAVPSLATPVAVIRRQRVALRFAARRVLTVPSGIARAHLAAWLAVRLVRAVPRLLAWAPTGDRLLWGTRS